MSIRILGADELRRVLSIRDLTDPSQGAHAMQLLVDAVTEPLCRAWGSQLRLRRASPIVSVRDNYDRLGYHPDAVTRDARYTRYVCDVALLRTHTSALIPAALGDEARGTEPDLLIACPGIVYRRDSIDRLHSGEPHQLDLWRIRREEPLGDRDLEDMIAAVVGAVLPGSRHRLDRTEHPYTRHGLEIHVEVGGSWIEIGECGLASPELLSSSGYGPSVSGLAMGLGLDRVLMTRKGIADIRLLRSTDPRIASQMLDLSPYREVSDQPATHRDLSIVTDDDTTAEELGDDVRAALGERASSIEAVEVLGETSYAGLPPRAIERLGILPGQKNVLIRVVLRDLTRTLTSQEGNELRDAIYGAVHRGTKWEWARRSRN